MPGESKMVRALILASQLREIKPVEFKRSGSRVEAPSYTVPPGLSPRSSGGARVKAMTSAELEIEIKKIEKAWAEYDQELVEKTQEEVDIFIEAIRISMEAIKAETLKCRKALSPKELAQVLDSLGEKFYAWRKELLELQGLSHRVAFKNPPQANEELLTEVEESFFSAVRTYNTESYSVLLSAISIFAGESSGDFKYTQCSEEDLEACQEISKVKVLVKLKPYRTLPFGIKVFSVIPDQPYYVLPLVSLGSFTEPLETERLLLKGVTDAELETLVVLHGGPAYQTFEDALRGARALI